MYELLTHRKAFDGKSLQEIVHAVEHARPPAPHELRPEVPLALSDITMRAIAHDPAQRYRSARQMSLALKQWVDAEAEIGAEEGSQARSGKRRLMVAALAVGAAIGVFAGWQLLGSADAESSHATEAKPAGPPATAPAMAPAHSAIAVTVATPAAPSDDGTVAASTATVDVPTAPMPAAAPPTPRPRATEKPAAREPRAAQETTTARSGSAAPAATGVVQLAVVPWGQIEVDGKGAGLTPPLAQLTLSVGEHVITVRNADFAPHTVTVRVSGDQPVVVRHRF
jgi:serine/threonine-protein kinase